MGGRKATGLQTEEERKKFHVQFQGVIFLKQKQNLGKTETHEREHCHGLTSGHPFSTLNLGLIGKLTGVFKDMLGKQRISCL